MIRKIKLWWLNRRHTLPTIQATERTYTYEQVKKIYALGHEDGRKEGLSIAREQAARSLSEILRQQNK